MTRQPSSDHRVCASSTIVLAAGLWGLVATHATAAPFPSAGVDVLDIRLDVVVEILANPYGPPVFGPTAISATGFATLTRGEPFASPPDGRHRIDIDASFSVASAQHGGLSISGLGGGQLRELTGGAAPGAFPAESLLEIAIGVGFGSTASTVFSEDSIVFLADTVDEWPPPLGWTHVSPGALDEDQVNWVFEDLSSYVGPFPMVLYTELGDGSWEEVGWVWSAQLVVIPEPGTSLSAMLLLSLLIQRRARLGMHAHRGRPARRAAS